MGESLLDWVYNTAEYRKEHHIPWIAKNNDGETLCESYDLNTLDKWLENPAFETPGWYKDQDTTLRVRVSEIPDSEECKIEYLHTEDSVEVLQETFYCQGSFWDLVHHEQEKLKNLNNLNDSDNPLRWKVKEP